MKKDAKTICGISMAIQIVVTAAVAVVLILLMNGDKDLAKYYLWNGSEIVYKNALNDVGHVLSAFCAFLSLPLMLVTIIAAIGEKKGSKRIIPILSSVVLTFFILWISVVSIFVYSSPDPFYPSANFYKFDADGVPIVLSERTWMLGAEIDAFRITDDGHAQKLDTVSDSPGTCPPGGKYDVTRDGDTVTISYYEGMSDTEPADDTQRVVKRLYIL